MNILLAMHDATSPGALFLQHCIDGVTLGLLIALIALGYTMVYGIIGLINFAHGDVFMLGSFLALAVVQSVLKLAGAEPAWYMLVLAFTLAALLSAVFCGGINLSVDYLVYKPLRHSPKLAPLVSAIGVSFIFMNIGQLWGGATDVNFPSLIPEGNLLTGLGITSVNFSPKDAVILLFTIPILVALTLLVKFTKLGKAMRATEQNPIAAQLMGIPVNQVIAATFAIGGALAGLASVVYAATINTIGWQIGFQNGLYAFTAAVLGGIGKLPGAVLGGLLIGLVRNLGSAYLGEVWSNAFIFGILIVILIFRPAGLLGSTVRDKV
jgi:branched-chain amino acid transport system permease protein